MSRRHPTLVLDWDGTVTEVDTLHLVLEEFGDVSAYRRAEDALGRSLTLHEVIALEFETVTAPLKDVLDWLHVHVRVRAGFRELVAAHAPIVLSSGFRELIEPILEREQVGVELRANAVEARPEGWRVHFRDDAVCAVCGEACKRGSLPDGPVIYVGDGYSDRCAALAAERIFARDGLARYLEDSGVAHEPFHDLLDVLGALDR